MNERSVNKKKQNAVENVGFFFVLSLLFASPATSAQTRAQPQADAVQACVDTGSVDTGRVASATLAHEDAGSLEPDREDAGQADALGAEVINDAGGEDGALMSLPDASAQAADGQELFNPHAALSLPPPGDEVLEISPRLDPEVREMITQALLHPALKGARVGLYVRSLSRDWLLLQKNPELLLNPASNAKLATAATALMRLGPAYRYETTYAALGEIVDGKLKGRLYVSGRGDPTITTERLLFVVHKLKMMGLKEIRGGIVVDDSFFDEQREALGWEQETSDHAFAAPVGALSLNYNAVAVDIYPGEQVGKPARYVVDPPSKYIDVDSRVMTSRQWGRVYMRSRRRGNKTHLRLRGRIGIGEEPVRIYRRVSDPALHFGGALAGLLEESGIKVRGRVRRGLMPSSAQVLFTDNSEPLGYIINKLNKYSNNIIAETLVKTLGAEFYGAPGTFANGHRVVEDFLQDQVGWQAKSYVYENGSGLNDVNRFSVQQIAQLLAYMRWRPEAGPEFVASLSVAGTQGTMRSRLIDTRAQGRLRAKTGTLTGVSALSGYASTAQDEPLVFSILINGYAGSVRPIWEVQDLIAEALSLQGAAQNEGSGSDLQSRDDRALIKLSASGGS